MPPKSRPDERYTIRRQVFKFIGAGFHVYNSEGAVVGYCKQKGFRLREDLRLFTDDSRTTEILRIATPNVIDFSAVYNVLHPTGEPMGAFRRKGMKSLLRDEWIVLDERGATIAAIREESGWLAFLRRVHDAFSAMIPQEFVLTLNGETEPLATFRTHFNPFIYRLGVAVHREHETLDDLLILAGACLIAAIEGRQG